MDELALGGLRRSAGALLNKIQINSGNFQVGRKTQETDFSQADLVLVDPPRSGLMGFLDPFAALPKKPEYFLYVSCFAESFSRDAKRLREFGYQLQTIQILDQFPQSLHFELVALFHHS